MLSHTELQRIVADLAPKLSGARLQRAGQPADATLVLDLYNGSDGGKHRLMLCADRKYGRMHLIGEARENPAHPPAFCEFVRGQLSDATLEAIEVAPGERIVHLRFATKDGPRALTLELIGANANLYVLGEGNAVLASMQPMRSQRELRRREPWVPPAPAPAGAANQGAVDRFASLSDGALHAAIGGYYGEQEQAETSAALRRKLVSALLRERRYIERAKRSINEDLEKAKDYPNLRKYGELLKGSLHLVAPGADAVTVNDYDEQGNTKPLDVALDPKLSAVENMEDYFKRYHKALTAAHKLSRHLNMIQGADEANAHLSRDLSQLPDSGLAAFAQRQDVAHLLERYGTRRLSGHLDKGGVSLRVGAETGGPSAVAVPRTTTKLPGISRRKPTAAQPAGAPVRGLFSEVPAALRPRRFTSIDGWDILVGRSASGNDYLTVKLANGNDWFFHVDGQPGSHVILRDQRGKSPPLETLLDCGQLALHYSSAKDAGRGQVRYTECKHVRKPRGAKPGLVTLDSAKTLDIRKDEARLARLLGKPGEESAP